MSATNAQRQAALKARRKAAGLVRVAVWVHQDWANYIKDGAKDGAMHNPMPKQKGFHGAYWPVDGRPLQWLVDED